VRWGSVRSQALCSKHHGNAFLCRHLLSYNNPLVLCAFFLCA
jgi:hypothetical protein